MHAQRGGHNGAQHGRAQVGQAGQREDVKAATSWRSAMHWRDDVVTPEHCSSPRASIGLRSPSYPRRRLFASLRVHACPSSTRGGTRLRLRPSASSSRRCRMSSIGQLAWAKLSACHSNAENERTTRPYDPASSACGAATPDVWSARPKSATTPSVLFAASTKSWGYEPGVSGNERYACSVGRRRRSWSAARNRPGALSVWARR